MKKLFIRTGGNFDEDQSRRAFANGLGEYVRWNNSYFYRLGDCAARVPVTHTIPLRGLPDCSDRFKLCIVDRSEPLSWYWSCVFEQMSSSASGFLYLIQCREFFKIGISGDFESRYRKYVTECPFPMNVVFSEFIRGNQAIEQSVLSYFSKKIHRGEWMRLSDSDVRLIRRMASVAKEDKDVIYFTPVDPSDLPF